MRGPLYRSLFFLVIFLSGACGEEEEQVEPKQVSPDWSSDHSVDYNQEISIREDLQIKLYLEHRKGLRMETSESTLRHQIVRKSRSSNRKAEIGDLITFRMKISLLDGRECYATDSIPEQFILGKSDLYSSGLQEGMLLMNESDKAKLIVPSLLGYGLLGDESRNIPPQSVLIYDIELLTVRK